MPTNLQSEAVAAEGLSPEWPWGEDAIVSVSPRINSPALPKISIVTPSLNQGKYLEETIRSVLLQGYPNLEYIVIDGGSTDGTLDILHEYSDQIDFWVSEPDRGQAHAINKGFEKATGDWLAWLNSDDLYLPGTLYKIAEVICAKEAPDWIVGTTVVVDENKNVIRKFEPVCMTDDWTDFLCNKRMSGTSFPQPSSFWSRRAWDEAGRIDESLRYVMDYEYWVRLALSGFRPRMISEELALFRLTESSKSGSGVAKFIAEEKMVVKKYVGDQPFWFRCYLCFYMVFLREIRCYRIIKNRIRIKFFDGIAKVKSWLNG